MMNCRKLILLSLTVPFICFSFAFGMDQQFTVEGYRIQVFTGESYHGVEAHGQVSGGRSCDSLEIEFDCINMKNEKANIRAIVRNAGGAGSRLLRASKNNSRYKIRPFRALEAPFLGSKASV